MKYFMIIGFIIGCIIGCDRSNKGTSVSVKDAQDDFQVVKLFKKDKCTVYRFDSEGRYHYFTDCSGSTSTWQPKRCGKTSCPYPEEINGGQ